jgi:CRISPR-associated protein Cas5d
MNENRFVCLNVKGDFACFTRPEYKVERLSYPVITATAALGILESVYWHPQISYKITRIEVLNEIKYHSCAMNELSKIRYTKTPIEFVRSTRSNQVLLDVSYNIYADIIPQPGYGIETCNKTLHIFNRNLKSGNYYSNPFLGMSNFKAYLSSISSKEIHPSLDCLIDLGLVLSGFDRKKIVQKDNTCYYEHTPIFSYLHMDKGVINFDVS